MQSPELVEPYNKVRLFWVFWVSLLVDTVLKVRASVKDQSRWDGLLPTQNAAPALRV